MDQAAWNDLLDKEKAMEQSRDDMKDKVKKMQNDITHAPDAITRKKLQLGLSNLLLAQQKLEIDYETLQNQKRLMQLESFCDDVAELIAEEKKDPVQAINEKISDTKLKIAELQQELKDLQNKSQYEKGLARANMVVDSKILKQQIKKLECDLVIFGYQIDKENNKKNIKECISKMFHGIVIKNEDINGYSHRFIPRYRGVKTVQHHDIEFSRVEEPQKMTDRDVDELIDKNYDVYCNFSKQQKEIFYKEFNEIVKDVDDISDDDMIVAISRLGIVLSSVDGNDEAGPSTPDKTNPDGSIGSIYDNISDYVEE